METSYGIDLIKKGQYAHSPAASLIGYQLKHVASGEVDMTLAIKPEHLNPIGTLDGGIISCISDAVMGSALVTTLEEGQVVTSIDIKVNFLKPAFANTTVRAEGRVIKRGKTTGLMDCHIYDETDSLIAHGTSVCMILNNLENGIRKQKNA